MRFHSVRFDNYKSIGTTDNEIIIEPEVTAIVGKNESGKSNIIEGLSDTPVRGKDAKAFSNSKQNRCGFAQNSIMYTICLKWLHDEDGYGSGDSEIKVSETNYSITGGFCKYYNSIIFPEMNSFISDIGDNYFGFRANESEFTAYRKAVNDFGQMKDSLSIPDIYSDFQNISRWFNRSSLENKEANEERFKGIFGKWMQLYELLPVIYLHDNNKELRTQYNEDWNKNFRNSKEPQLIILKELLKIIDVPLDAFIEAVAGDNPGKSTYQEGIRERIEENISKKFQKHYTTEKIKLIANFPQKGVVKFMVKSEQGAAMALSERSNGLRWFLSLFIDAFANNLPERNVLYLFDEPGVFLHVNAQTELLRMFKLLAANGNQVVYTTHSPYMLDTNDDGIHRIRAVDKDSKGYTHIYKTAYDPRICKDNKLDTLSPIIAAIGMEMGRSIGPQSDKVNIIVEGMSDYIYLKTFARILDFNISYLNIITAVGVGNVVHICKILSGWGYPWLAIFDYDKEGVEKGGNKLHEEIEARYNMEYMYIYNATEEDLRSKTYNNNKIVIEDLVTQEMIDQCNNNHNLPEKKSSNNKCKTLVAKFISDDIDAGISTANDKCKNNFTSLFNRIISIVESKKCFCD